MKGWWFKSRAKQIMESSSSGATFKFSDDWFSGFKRRYKISLRRPTNTAQNSPKDKETAVMNFHRQIQLGDGKGDGPLADLSTLTISQ